MLDRALNCGDKSVTSSIVDFNNRVYRIPRTEDSDTTMANLNDAFKHLGIDYNATFQSELPRMQLEVQQYFGPEMSVDDQALNITAVFLNRLMARIYQSLLTVSTHLSSLN